MEPVELRSDTFTKPTPEMRRAMAEAVVGDDVWGEDPTANALQEQCAALFGKEAGLFVPSGSMGNEVAIKALTNPGEEVIVEASAHVIEAEVGAPATISQVIVRALPGRRGVFDLDELADAIRLPSRFFTHTSLVCLENTHQGSGGAVVPIEAFRDMAKVARDRGVRVHLDGARIFNASVASGVHVREYAAEVDTLSFCFSKGLGAPVGSMLLGQKEEIERARRVRKMLGGGMRQVGVLCAAAKVALETGIERLADDHANAKRLAAGIAEAWPGSIDPAGVETNILYVYTGDQDAEVTAGALKEKGVLVGPMGARRLRLVTHRDVDAAAIERAIDAFRALG
ncbi:MAG: aminotransferase class I/II-fold pyridoxal phosphate-dependent enzyme [Actinobacteria bacterium]|nr:MAG: aminotransferase class I/II-fold pyridoxal phosphate-dependent enzyme [Actinomycetota bacterium]